MVLWDLGHHNFGRVKVHEAQRAWVSRDGYVVRPFHGQFEQAILSEADIVVIRIALAAVNDTHGFEQLEASKWILPNPSAFLPSESESVDTAGFFVFRRADGTLSSHPVTEGRADAERIDSVATEAGRTLRLPPGGVSTDSGAVGTGSI